MPLTDPQQLKRLLRAEGFEIYRTRETDVVLAERVRDNLIMDSGVAVIPQANGNSLGIAVVIRAQATHFPGASADHVLAHARGLAEAFESLGYRAAEAQIRELADPSNPGRSLDTSYEIPLTREVDSEEELVDQLKQALALRRSSTDD